MPESFVNEARRLARSQGSGLLSTLSLKFKGYPFGSAIPVLMDSDLNPVFWISFLAEHTKNLLADPKASLTLIEPSENVQDHARLTLIGQARNLGRDAIVRDRYFRYFPDAQEYQKMHDFTFWKLDVEHVRFIGGFGSIHWIPSTRYTPGPCELDNHEPEILRHMNQDHQADLFQYCQFKYRMIPSTVQMIGIDEMGFDVLADGKRLRFEFPFLVHTVNEARQALIHLSRTDTCSSGDSTSLP
ncbi:MAG: DUF2470 domain-containing protein [Proteobacteria bacterium]|nr:DUF2470 domain-containing protein [Pseudomonadota bacterium]